LLLPGSNESLRRTSAATSVNCTSAFDRSATVIFKWS
jgi:hypothetical protein